MNEFGYSPPHIMDIDDGEECVFTEEDNEMFEAFEREMA